MSLRCQFTLLSIALFAFTSHAGDLGFRYNGTACVDKTGATGYNPSYIGQCGDLRHVTISGLTFDGTDLSGSQFDSSNLEGTSFSGANMTGVSFVGADLSGVILTNATIHGTNFTKSNLRNAHLAGADIQKSDFSGVDLTGQVFSTLSLGGSKFVGANLTGATLDSTDFSGCDLTKATLSKANLQSAKLDGAKLTQAILNGADLTQASVQKVNGASASFLGALIRKANLNGATLTGANMRSAQMDQATITNANLSGVDLRSAVLKDAVITGSNFNGARINKNTVLPVSLDDAEKMGMFLDTSINLLVIYDRSEAYFGELMSGLQQSNLNVMVSSEDMVHFAGDIDLTEYNAVLLVNAYDYNTDMPTAGQTALVNFVQGGGTFIATGAVEYPQSNGYFKNLSDLILFDYQSQTSSTPTITIANGQAGHPLLTGFSTSTTLKFETYTTGTLHSFGSNPSTVLMSDGGSNPSLAARSLGSGHVVGLSMCGANDDSCFADSNVIKLIINAASWDGSAAAVKSRGKKIAKQRSLP